MKINKSQLQKIVREETIRHLVGLMEADEHEVVDANDDHKKKDAQKGKKEPSKKPGGSSPSEPKELPTDNEPADNDLGDEVSTPESDLEKDSVGKGIGDPAPAGVVGLQIQSFTVEPQPKSGAAKTELVLTFKNSPNPLRIMILPNGEVEFAYRGDMEAA